MPEAIHCPKCQGENTYWFTPGATVDVLDQRALSRCRDCGWVFPGPINCCTGQDPLCAGDPRECPKGFYGPWSKGAPDPSVRWATIILKEATRT